MHVDHIVVRELIPLTLDASQFRRTGDGYLVANPRVGRTGIQVYRGSELGRADMDKVRVWRPEAEVMDKAAMGSIAHRPVTNDHPSEPVTADNWRKYAVGQTGGEIARDGDFIRVPLVVMDGNTIKDVESGKRELSLGYSSNIEWRSGVTDAGESYDAVQTQIRVNHLAIVDAARGGPKLAIGDGVSLNDEGLATAKKLIADGDFELTGNIPDGSKEVVSLANTKYPIISAGIVYSAALVATRDLATAAGESTVADAATALLQLIDKHNEENPAMADRVLKTMLVDGITCEMTDTAIEVVTRRCKTLEDALFKANTETAATTEELKKKVKTGDEAVATLTTQVQQKDAEIATLKTQLADAKITPAKLDQLVKDRAVVVEKARTILGDKLVVDGKDLADIQKQVVLAKLGDAAKDWNDVMISASFATLTAGDAGAGAGNHNRMSDAFSGHRPSGASAQDGGQKVYDAYDKRIQDAWKGGDEAKH